MDVTLLHKISKFVKITVLRKKKKLKKFFWDNVNFQACENILLKTKFIGLKPSRLDKSSLYHSFQALSYCVVGCLKGSYPL